MFISNTPERVVEIALERGIPLHFLDLQRPCLCGHEFVMATSLLQGAMGGEGGGGGGGVSGPVQVGILHFA